MKESFLDRDGVFIIAEIGGNHEGSFEYAKKLLEDVAESGASAVKYQIYRSDAIVSKVEAPEQNTHFKKFELADEEFIELIELAKARNLEFLTSIWDRDSLEKFDPYLTMHKIGSGDLTNYPMLKAIAEKNKPILLATGMSDLDEVKESVKFIDSVNPVLRKEGKLCVLQCVAMYGKPRDEFVNLNVIKTMQKVFPDIHIGYSDHNKGSYACELAIALGVRVIEVHFTDDKTREFRDHELSVTTDEMKELVENAKRIQTLLGESKKAPVTKVETAQRIRKFRRAVYLSKDAVSGTELTEDLLVTLRPNEGIDARRFYELLGKKLTRDIKAFEAIRDEDIV